MIHKSFFVACAFGAPLSDEHAKQHPCHVGVQNRGALAERKTADRAGGVHADPFERQQRGLVRRQAAPRRCDGLSRNRLQTFRPDVVSERPPCLRHVALGRIRERFERRIFLEPFVVFRQHAIDLRLLEHDFRHEDVVRIGGFAPWQRASVTVVHSSSRRLKFRRAGTGGMRARHTFSTAAARALAGSGMPSGLGEGGFYVYWRP